MMGKDQRRKKPTIFRIFLVPLIAIMLVQSMITIGTLVVRGLTSMLEEYSSGMMTRLVENRKVILENEMNQRWGSVYEQEPFMNEILEQFLDDYGINAEELLDSDDMKGRFLERLFPECLAILQNNTTTGVFVVLTGQDMKEAGDFDGFFIRDSDPDTNPVNYTDLLLERGSKQLSREWNIPLDTSWTTHFHMEGQGERSSENYFYEPWRAGSEHRDTDISNLGYWSPPFFLEKDTADSYEMITYSLPLRHEGKVYGVMGVEISTRSLYEYFPVAELNASQQSGYMLALSQDDGSCVPLAGKGVLYSLVASSGDRFRLKSTGYESLSQVENVSLDKQGIYAVACPLRLYGNNAPYDDTEWVLLGLNTQEDLFGMSRRLYIWILASVLIGLAFGVIGLYFLVRHLTKPVQYLMSCIGRGRAGLEEFKPSNILEVDSLYEVVRNLSDRQKEAENVLLEEKERYRVALEWSRDIFFSYDPQRHMVDIVNHETMSGQWPCEEFESGFINPGCIYPPDREAAIKKMQSREDQLYAEFRMRWPEDGDYVWVALSAKAVYDTDGRRRKLVGSIRNIQEQKKLEEEQLRKNTTDGVTGLYAFAAGMKCLEESGSARGEGIVINLLLDRLKEINEKNGIVFGDMILEELGNLIQSSCARVKAESGNPATALRLDGDEFVVWLENAGKDQASGFVTQLLEKIAASFREERFDVSVYAGLACSCGDKDAETMMCMAKLASSFAVDCPKRYLFFEDIPERKRSTLPPLLGRAIHSLDYGGDVSLVSVALNLFGRGADFPAQMMLMIRKIGRAYQADGVLVSVLRGDFNSNYLNFQWHKNGEDFTGSARTYREEDRDAFYQWLGQKAVRYFSIEDSRRAELQCFLSIPPGQSGVVLPMYDNGSYMGNICILGIAPGLLEDSEEYQNLAELGRVIQGQLNQQQHDIASKAKSEFLSRMSHEIRTPMNGIIGMTAIALQKEQSPERIMDCLQKIQSSSNYLLGLINDILDMSKIESGKMKLETVNFNMNDMLETVRELIRPQAEAKEIHFVQDVTLTDSWFSADRMRISQILINLLGNAVKFTPQKGRISLTVREERNMGTESLVFFAVRDTGTGIAKEDQERVFRSFEQSSSNQSKQQGTGLGLSISSRLVKMMGSEIRLDSEPGEGSTFSFSIVLVHGNRVETDARKEELSFDGCHVLVVEDNELNAEIAQSLLEDRNFVVDCVYDGAQAVERVRTTAPGTYDVILMDIMMPVMNGLDAARAIRAMDREDCRTIPIVAMSANAFDDDLKKSVECGMNGHLSKPVEVDKLYEMLGSVIYRKQPL